MTKPVEEKKIYEPAELEIVTVDQADIICTSPSGRSYIEDIDDEGYI